jgi:hypothetical protein
MKTVTLLVVTLCASATAYADFSYTTTRKAQGPTAAAAPSSTKYYYKGQKMMTDSDAVTMIMISMRRPSPPLIRPRRHGLSGNLAM